MLPCTSPELNFEDRLESMDLDAEDDAGRRPTGTSVAPRGGCSATFKCIYCKDWSGPFEDFTWHMSERHGIPSSVAKGICKAVINRQHGDDGSSLRRKANRFAETHFSRVPENVLSHERCAREQCE